MSKNEGAIQRLHQEIEALEEQRGNVNAINELMSDDELRTILIGDGSDPEFIQTLSRTSLLNIAEDHEIDTRQTAKRQALRRL